MNGIDPITPNQERGEQLLSWWGLWNKRRFENLGYSKETIESRLMREGVLIPTIGKLEETDYIAELVEFIISRFPPKQKKVVKIEYLTYTTRKEKQKRVHLSEYKYTLLLREAQDRVSYEFDLKNNHVRTTLISLG